jgi:hypothetical protein
MLARNRNLEVSAVTLPQAWDPVWPNWALVAVGGFAAWAALRTLGVIREQTGAINRQLEEMRSASQQTDRMIEQTTEHARAAKDTAESSLLHAKSIINSERAWVVVKMQKRPTNESFVLSLKNCGRTPARISIVKQLETFIPPGEPLKVDADFRYEQPLRFMHPPMLIPREKWEARDFVTTLREVLPEPTLTEVRQSRMRYWIYGKVEYTDTITFERRETRFCFFYSPTLDEMVVGGPVGANDYT